MIITFFLLVSGFLYFLKSLENNFGKNTSKKYNLDFEETIFITDSSGDLKETNHFSELTTLGVTFGIHCKETLEEENPNFICYSWKEIEKIIL